MFRILALILLPVICLAQVNSNGEKPTGELLSNEISPNEMKRNASFNLDEIKVRWKKAALENCTGVPCVTTPAFTCGTSTVSDIDNNAYNTVLIGTQCWTQSNLKVTKYNDGSDIPLDTYLPGGFSPSWNRVTGAYAIYGNQLSSGANATNYGFLYNWYAAKGIVSTGSTTYKNLCPTGFHVPTDSDWNELILFIHSGANTTIINGIQSSLAGTMLKKKDALWSSDMGTDDFGFSALPGGIINGGGGFSEIRNGAYFWSATETGSLSSTAISRSLQGNTGGVGSYDNTTKTFGHSVRCLKD